MTPLISKPLICCIDLDDKIVAELEKSGMNIFNGSLGNQINVPNAPSQGRTYHEIKKNNYIFPQNIQEYDIFVINLDYLKTTEYNRERHTIKSHTGKDLEQFICSYPETIFNPRPYSASILRDLLDQIAYREHLVIIFSTKDHIVEYQAIRTSETNRERMGIQKHSIYSIRHGIPTSKTNYGFDVSICKNNELTPLLNKYKGEITYNQTFDPITKYSNGKEIEDKAFIPLIENINNDIVSYLYRGEYETLVVFPQFTNLKNFIIEYLTEVAPSCYPELFPYSTKHKWKEQKEYWLPNHDKLINDKNAIIQQFEKNLKNNESEIDKNTAKYSFLHDILTETDSNLVIALIEYLKWLGFNSVVSCDEMAENVLEEDIQITLPDGLLIIECKGIGGTSTDSDCSQISKIKFRRCKQRNKFDVKALYIVNHQRHSPPSMRKNPPFTNEQINDALHDERGLLSTWQLFNLYFDIENNIISKDEAREALLNYGLVQFRPKKIVHVDKPTEILKDGEVCIVNINDLQLKVSDELFIEKGERFSKASILGIQLNDTDLTEASNGELGLKLSKKIEKGSTIWKRVD